MNTMNINIAANDNQNTIEAARDGGITLNYSVGGMIKGTVLGIGEQACVGIGDRQVKVSPEVVKNRKVGEEMELMVSSVEEQSVVLKAMQSVVGASGGADAGELLSNTSRLEIMRNTEQFINVAAESDIRIEEADEVSEEAREVAKLSAEDLAMLRRMGIDAAHADISHLMGLINQFHAQQEGRSFQTGSREVVDAIAKAQSLPKLSEGAMRYLLMQDMPFTYENVYKAEFIAAENYEAGEMEPEEWQQLEPQVVKLLISQGMENNSENIAAAKWLIEQQLDVTREHVKEYQNMLAWNEYGMSKEEYSNNVIASLMLGETEEQAELSGEGLALKAQKQHSLLAELRQEDVDLALRLKKPMNLFTLFELSEARQHRGSIYDKASMDEAAAAGYNADNKEQVVALQSAAGEALERQDWYWQLEQLRLRMTLQSGYQLLKQNPKLLRLDLKEVVEELNALEARQSRSLFRDSRVELKQETSLLYQETMAKTAVFKNLPAMALGQWFVAKEPLTLNYMFRQGMELAHKPETAVYQEAGEYYYETMNGKLSSYERLMTAPRYDMGDSIQKAFANMDSLLSELGLELTAENKKAVRILSYNQMELTDEAVEQIKELDGRLVSLLDRMKPEIVLGMIRDGINPLRMELSKLLEAVSEQEQKLGKGSDEAFSEFLYRLEKRGEITREEKESYIGVYRLLNTITGHSGRDLGAVVRNEETVTLEHLLRAHRSRNRQGTDVSIGEDMDFHVASGGFKKDIIAQLETAFADMKQKEMFNEGNEELAQDIELTEEQNIRMAALADVDRNSVLLLQGVGLAYTPANLMASEQLMKHSGDFYQSIKQELKEHGQMSNQAFHDLEQKLYERMELLERQQLEQQADMEQIKDASLNQQTETIQEIYENAFVSAFHEVDEDTTFTAKDLLAVGQIHTRMRVAAALGQQQDYVVPVALSDEVLTMTVHFNQQGTQKKGFVAQVETKEYGVITAELKLQREPTLILSCQEEAGREAIRGGLTAFHSLMDAFPAAAEQIRITDRPGQDTFDHYLEMAGQVETVDDTGEEAAISKVMLYDVAKAFVSLIRSL